MSEALKIGDVVRYKLDGRLMTVVDAGPVAVGRSMGAASGGVSHSLPMSEAHVKCKWFDKAALESKVMKKIDLEYVRSSDHFAPQEGDAVQLASGGPRMIVDRCGPKDFSTIIGFGGGIARTPSNIRHDLTGCKWVNGKKEGRGEFEIGSLIPL
ncbi:DUF2158 domain-containing protein [Pseudomonas putida]|uniref:DUF2158 domain-containing protein n=1 Tax=Pseudomonas putida TaxID=303 RepID=UPI0013149321|nr:DUF2158 domain-containing protein [Pseudomonas putida]